GSGDPLDMSWDNLLIKKVHLTYYDDAAGIDTDLTVPEAAVVFSAFNPSYSRYHPTDISLSGTSLSLRLFKPVDLGIPEEIASTGSDTLDLKLGRIDFREIAVRYTDEESGMLTDVQLPKLLAQMDHVYLDGQRVGVKELEIADSKVLVAFEPRAQVVEDPAQV